MNFNPMFWPHMDKILWYNNSSNRISQACLFCVDILKVIEFCISFFIPEDIVKVMLKFWRFASLFCDKKFLYIAANNHSG